MQPEMQPELVFGLVGPIGVDMTLVQERLCSALRSVGYKPMIVHLTKVMEDRFKVEASEEVDSKLSYTEKILRANSLREQFSDRIMAALAVSEIRTLRSKWNQSHEDNVLEPQNSPSPGAAYIIRQLKHPAEVKALKAVYGENFVQISVALDEYKRIQNLTSKFGSDDPSLSSKECEDLARNLVDIDNNEKSHDHGQRISKIYHLGDAFISGVSADAIKRTVDRFIDAFFGRNSIGPTKDEYGAYFAKATSLRSVDPARQVGAAILSAAGDIITVGCNEVPKYGGGNYWSDEDHPQRDVELQTESNKVETKRIVYDFLKRLKNKRLLREGASVDDVFTSKELGEALDGSKIEAITEFGRMTHAEMSALSDAARLGRSVKGAIMHVTTFPCHNCAKHIIASGIERVIYIEPYDKSRAEILHGDAISVDEDKSERVIFQHFEGISPRRYRNIFEKGSRRSPNGGLQEWYKGVPSPQISPSDPNYVTLEAILVHDSFNRSAQSSP